MKEYYFDKFPKKEEIISKIISDSSLGSSSIEINRTIIRPELKYSDYFILISSPAFLIITIIVFLFGDLVNKFTVVILFTIYELLMLKKVSLVLIRFYQAFAPLNIRMKCCFTPSCSEYTYISINRFGLIKGLIKGYHRIRRCNPQNAGVDNPET